MILTGLLRSCFVVPIAPIPSCFDGRFATSQRSYPITLVVPEMMNLTVKSSRAGSNSNSSRFLYPTLVFNLSRMAHTPLIYATGQFFLSCQPTPSPSSPPVGLCFRSSKSPLNTLPLAQNPFPLLPFFFFHLHVHFYSRLTFPSDEARDTLFFHLYVTQMFPTYVVPPIHRTVSTCGPVHHVQPAVLTQASGPEREGKPVMTLSPQYTNFRILRSH